MALRGTQPIHQGQIHARQRAGPVGYQLDLLPLGDTRLDCVRGYRHHLGFPDLQEGNANDHEDLFLPSDWR